MYEFVFFGSTGGGVNGYYPPTRERPQRPGLLSFPAAHVGVSTSHMRSRKIMHSPCRLLENSGAGSENTMACQSSGGLTYGTFVQIASAMGSGVFKLHMPRDKLASSSDRQSCQAEGGETGS